MAITDLELRDYANVLYENGFTIYEPAGRWKHFIYSQLVDGVECFGIVEREDFGDYRHLMPIKPSREHGSSIFVDGVQNELTVDAALIIAQPENRNHLVGSHKNYRDPEALAKHYIKWSDSSSTSDA